MSADMLNPEDAFELKTIRQDLLSDALFLIGTFISIDQNKKAEQKILNPPANQAPEMNAASANIPPFGLGPVVLVLFLAGTSILAFTATERLNRQKAEVAGDAGQAAANNIKGGEIVILGQFVRIIGYIISIFGERIREANPV